VITVIAIACLIVVLLGVGSWSILHDSHRVHERIDDLERRLTGLNGRVNTVADETELSHAQLVDDLWRRASAEVDQEIEKARRRGRDF
jgi:hypothetical protein